MKILKSGIEMTPDELIKLKGGAICACGCGTGYSGEQLNASGSGGCTCGCTGPSKTNPKIFEGNSKGAHDNFHFIF